MNDQLVPDVVVARALQAIPVPDHRPGFWDELEARLAATLAGDEVPVRRRLSARGKRRPRLRAALLAAAVLVLVAMAVVALVVDRRLGREIEPVTTQPPTTTTATTTTPSTTLDPVRQVVSETVGRFVTALATDNDAAWAMLTAESQQFLGDAATLASGLGATLSGWAADGAVEREYVMLASTPDGDEVAIVAYAGVVEVGLAERQVQAFAVVREDGEWRIELTTIGEPASAGPYIALVGSDPIRFSLAMGPSLDEITVAVDGDTIDASELELSGESLTIRRQLAAGSHVVIVAVVQPGGLVFAHAVDVTVEAQPASTAAEPQSTE
jgi:hypothetical protein